MKKHLIIYVAILIGIYIVLSMLDTGEYRVEKQFWRVQKDYVKIAQDPKSVPSAQYGRVINRYEGLIKKFPDSRLVPQMYSSIGSLYIMNNEYDQARKVFGHVATKFNEDPVIAAKAFMDVANVYLIEKKIKQAVDVYNRIWDDYPETEVGFLSPFYIIGIYEVSGKAAMVNRYLEKAIAFYTGIARDESKNKALRINAYQMLANAYIGQKKWDAAVNMAESMLYDFADDNLISPRRLKEITRTINLVLVIRAKEYDRARSLYRTFIQKHPGHYLNQYLEKVIESLNLLEEKYSQPVTPQQ